jgi:Fic family protein
MKPYIPRLLPIEKLDWKPFIKYIGPANAALARYDGMLQAVLNPRVLLSPLTTQEAVLSSKIEGTQATLEEVLAFEGANQKPKEEYKQNDITEILNYRRAMDYAIEELKTRPMNLNLVNKIHHILLDSVRGQDKARGEFRRTQNWIGRPGSTIDNAKYVPPEPLKVPDYMSNLEKYIHLSEDDCLVQLAVVHAQFEIIHPYLDGNGRVGRILLPLFLYQKNMLSSPMFYLSAYLEANRDEYYSRLQAITKENDWLGWITFFLKAILQQAQANAIKTKAILDLYEVKKGKISAITHSQYAIKTVDALFRSPVFTTTRFILESNIPKFSAIRIIKQLRQRKILTLIKKGSGKTPATYLFDKLIDIVKT